uniref:non-specific serine/threonine protein kinase n=2 Tax=Rhodnius prolixus TaxID=13249 RepID=T1I6A3_RHOPR
MSYKLEDFEVLEVIGSGSVICYGTCYKVRNKFSKELFVWKAVDYGNLAEDHKRMLVSEVNLLKSLNHPHIVKYCGKILHKETTTLYIITEWCEGGDLSRVIKDAKENGKFLEEQFIWQMLYQISRAVQVCHSRLRDCTIFHRDIKPSNVFLDCHGNAKLGDFGLARIVTTENDFSKTFVGTPYYMSPELVKGRKYNRKSDIWALGCLVYELCALMPPFNGSTIIELANTIKRGKYKSIPSHYSESIRKIVSFMLSTKHEFRPTIEMILHHPSVVINIKEDKKIGSSNQ